VHQRESSQLSPELEGRRFPSTVGILGAGAVGSYLGGRLAREGIAVRLVARGQHARALAHDGLTVASGTEEFQVEVDVSEDVASLASADLVLLTVKSSDTKPAAEQLTPHLAANAVVISIQNGVRNWERVAEVVGKHPVLAGVAMFGVELPEPGRVTNPLPGPLVVGDPIRAQGTTLAAAAALLGRGVTVEVVDDIRSATWAKLVINTDMAVLALTGKQYPTGLLDEDVHFLCRSVMDEALGTIRAAGLIHAESVVTQVMDRKMAMLALPGADLRVRVEAMNVSFTPSTLQSVMKGRASETPFLNGEVAAIAASIGKPAPLNRELTRLMETTRWPVAFMDPAELRMALQV